MSEAKGKARILCLSDVAPGYGSPQLQHLAHSLGELLGDGEIMLVCPDEKGRKLSAPLYDNIELNRVVTFMPPYDDMFIVEYNRAIVDVIRAWKPTVIIASHGWVLPAVMRCEDMDFRLIYYMLESLAHQERGMGPWARDLNADGFERADIILTPERRRLETDVATLGVLPRKYLEIYNVAPSVIQRPVPAGDRTPAILVAGAIGERALTGHIAAAPPKLAFNIAGPAKTDAARELLGELAQREATAYWGMLPAAEVVDLRSAHAYSLVMWAPNDINQLYASPNKFFESIAAGTPPICAPHPQCVEVIKKYDCGILMDDWSVAAFVRAVTEAMSIFETDAERYQALIDNCLQAAHEELSWHKQFNKFREMWP